MRRGWQLAALGVGVALTIPARAQQLSRVDRERAQGMLQVIAADVRKHYYDPKFHGVDWEAKVHEAHERIDKATSLSMAFSHIATALAALDDSHTFFAPPSRPFRHDYGWRIQMVGDHCYITEVRPRSDAEAKGLKPGDEILTINGYVPTRENLWKIQYLFNVLRPQPGLRLNLRDLDGRERQLDMMAQVRQLKRVMDLVGSGASFDVWEIIREIENQEHLARARFVELGEELMILKIPQFVFSEADVNHMIGKARKRKALILDLRGNPGGSVETLKYFLGGIFDHDVKVSDRAGREQKKPLVAKSKKNDAFAGKLVVLIDSESGSAAELFARVVQLEKRGVVLGARSSGSVMEARRYSYQMGIETAIFYGASITDADLIMTDGKSLEHTGVAPDKTLLPAASDLATGSDPVLAHAAELLGVKLNPEQAGKLFPFEWPSL